jgi:uncharacterized phage-associated protein
MAALLAALGVLATAKTHRLLYYVQAWHLAWEGVGMFPNRIEAWASGPIVPEVFAGHAGTYRLEHAPRGASARRLAPGERSTINAVLGFYGGLEGHELASLAQNEDPWLEARQAAHLVGLERGHARITQQSMRRYYGGLAQAS